VGLALLGVPESLGGISEERSVVAGALVAEALARGDLGLAVAVLAPGAVATAISTWGTDEQQQTYLPAFTGGDALPAALALTEPRPLFDALDPTTTARHEGDELVLDGVKSMVPRASRRTRSARPAGAARRGRGARSGRAGSGRPGCSRSDRASRHGRCRGVLRAAGGSAASWGQM
jgi:alkylation response protein AidB-like acyl-CoA dehydrogenase